MDHRTFFERNHTFQKDARSFVGTVESGKRTELVIGSKVLNKLSGFDILLGKKVKENPKLSFNLKKNSIF